MDLIVTIQKGNYNMKSSFQFMKSFLVVALAILASPLYVMGQVEAEMGDALRINLSSDVAELTQIRKQVTASIYEVEGVLIEASGGVSKVDNEPQNPTDDKVVYKLMVRDSLGTFLENALNTYTNQLNQIREKYNLYAFNKLNLSGAEDPRFSHADEIKSLTYSELYFRKRTPLYFALDRLRMLEEMAGVYNTKTVSDILMLSSQEDVLRGVSEIKEKFNQLDNSLKRFTLDSQGNSQLLIEKMKKRVKEQEHSELNVTNAEKINALSKGAIESIELIKNMLIERSGGYGADGYTLVGAKNTQVVQEVMFDDTLGVFFERVLDEYVVSINLIREIIEMTPIPSLTFDSLEDPNFQNSDMKQMSFLELYFDHTPMIAALAIMTERQSKIATYENEMLNVISAKVKSSSGSED